MGQYPPIGLHWRLEVQLQCLLPLDRSLQRTGRSAVLYRRLEREMVLALGDAYD